MQPHFSPCWLAIANKMIQLSWLFIIYAYSHHQTFINGLFPSQGIIIPSSLSASTSSSALWTGKKGKTIKTKSGGGFGKKISPPCPCGSGLTYNDCSCSSLHGLLSQDDPTYSLSSSFSSYGPDKIVRSRYSAYSLKSIPYIIKTTSKVSPRRAGAKRQQEL